MTWLPLRDQDSSLAWFTGTSSLKLFGRKMSLSLVRTAICNVLRSASVELAGIEVVLKRKVTLGRLVTDRQALKILTTFFAYPLGEKVAG